MLDKVTTYGCKVCSSLSLMILALSQISAFAQESGIAEQFAQKADQFYPSQLDSAQFFAEKSLEALENSSEQSALEEEMLDLLGLIHRRIGNPEKSEEYFLQAISLSISKDNDQQLADSYNRIGLLYRGIGRVDEAIGFYYQSIALKQKLGDDRGVAGSWNNLGSAYRIIGNRDSAFISYQKSIEIRETLGDQRYLSSALLNMGNWLVGEEDFTNARNYYEQFKAIQEEVGDTTALVLVNTNIGALFNVQAVYDSALVYYLESEKLMEMANISDLRRAAQIKMGIARIYEQQEYPLQAIEYYKNSLEIYHQFQDPNGKSSAYQNLGKIFSDLGQIDSSLFNYERSLEEVSVLNNPSREATLLNNIAVLHNLNKDYELALQYSRQADSIVEELDERRQQAEVKYNLGASLFYLGQFQSAVYEYQQSLRLANETQHLELEERSSLGLAEAYGALGDYSNAFKYQVMYDTFKDSLMSMERLSVIEELITKYETEKVEAENELLVAKQAQNEAIIKQRNAENRALLFGLFALIVAISSFVGWVIYSNRKKKVIALQKEKLYQNNIDSLLNKQQLESMSAMLQGQDKERKRLAAELHDRLGSILSLVKLYFSSMDEDIKQKQPDLYDSFTEGNQFLDDAFVEVRALIKEMKEGAASGEGLKKDIEKLLEKIKKLGVNIKSSIELEKKLDNIVELNVYRVIQEALSNSLKYSKADLIELELSDAEHLMVNIRDNGVGFDPNERSQKQHQRESYGVENMEHRIKILGGDFSLVAAKKEGVSINIRIPMVQNEGVWSIVEIS